MATRRERVVLELDDQFTAGILRAAAATKLADKAMGDFGGTNTRTARSVDASGNAVNKQSKSLNDLDLSARRAERSGSALIDAFVALGPALLPVGALAVPAVAGLAAQLGFAAAAGGTAILAFNGVGDALKALDVAQLEPTAANLTKLDQAMAKLGPDARAFVRELDSLEPQLRSIKRAAEGGILPGVSEGIDSLLTRLPQVRHIVAEISGVTGDLASEAGASLASDKFNEFFDYLQHNAQPILLDLGRTVGNLTLGMANLFSATAPEQQEFSTWLLGISRDFEHWSDGLEANSTFQDLMDYVHQNGPQVAETFGSIARALVSVAQAAAPLGGPTLGALEAVANVIAKIADSPLGTPLIALASGLALVNRALATRDLARGSTLGQLISGRTETVERARTSVRGLASDLKAANSFGMVGGFAGTRAMASTAELEKQAAAAGRIRSQLGTLGKGAALGVGSVAVLSGLTDKLHVTNTATLALAGSFAGPLGAGAGAAVGAFLDLRAASEDFSKGLESLHRAVERGDFDTAAAQAKELKKQLDDLNTSSGTLDSIGDAFGRLSGRLSGNLEGPSGFFDKLTTYSRVFQGNFSDLTKGSAKSLQFEADVDTAKGQRDMAALTASAILAGQGLSRTAVGAREVAEGVDGMTRSLTRGREALNLAGNVDAYKAALDDLRGALRANGRTLDANTEKGRANRASLRNIASTALSVADGLRGVGKVRFLDRARTDFIAAATAAGMTRAAAKRLADQFGLLNRLNPKVKVTVDGVLTAKANVAQLINALTGLHDKTIRINTVTTNSKTPMAAGYADGGLVSGPGGPRDDKVRALLSNGEFVVNANATQRFRRELEWMNARRYANGGAVGRPAASVVSLAGMRIVGTLDTPWGPAQVAGIAQEAVDRTLAGRDSMATAASVAAGPSIPGGWD